MKDFLIIESIRNDSHSKVESQWPFPDQFVSFLLEDAEERSGLSGFGAHDPLPGKWGKGESWGLDTGGRDEI